MKIFYISVCVTILMNQMLSANAVSYNRVERQTFNMNQMTQILDTITRFSNPSNVFEILSSTFNSVLKIFDPVGILTRGRRKVDNMSDSIRHERDLYNYLVKASKENLGFLIKIHDEVDLEEEYGWRIAHIPEDVNLPEMPPIPGTTVDDDTAQPPNFSHFPELQNN